MAASTAEPPALRISTPACVAKGLAAATMPADLDGVLAMVNSGTADASEDASGFVHEDSIKAVPIIRAEKSFICGAFFVRVSP